MYDSELQNLGVDASNISDVTFSVFDIGIKYYASKGKINGKHFVSIYTEPLAAKDLLSNDNTTSDSFFGAMTDIFNEKDFAKQKHGNHLLLIQLEDAEDTLADVKSLISSFFLKN